MPNTQTALIRRSALIAAIASLTLSLAHAEQPPITLAKSSNGQTISADSPTAPVSAELRAARENYREFARTKVAQSTAPELFTLEFHATTTLNDISANHDFHVTGGTCREGHSYSSGTVCNVEVTFTPTGPGHRTGQLSVAHSAAATPFLTPIGGTASGPTISFIPSQMTTVPGTYIGTGNTAAGLLLSPQGLAVDGGDNLYIADTGNNLIRFRDSSGTISSFIGGGNNPALNYQGFGSGIQLNGPRGVAVDYSGTVYFTDTGDNLVLVRYIDGILNNKIGQGANADNCSFASPCLPNNEKINPPYSIATDPQGSFYTTLQAGGGLPGFYLSEDDFSALSDVYYVLSSTAYNYYSTSSAIAVDASGNVFYTYEDPGTGVLSPTPLCYVLAQNRALSTSAPGGHFWTVAGSGKCGFSGDGGRATGAEISTNIGQFAFDAAGNFYFADTGNNRIRRVDALNGVIRTLAGNGANGFGGDGGPSTYATLQAPAALAVDSTGHIYATGIGASAANPGNSLRADIRMFGNIGQLSFPTQATASHSTAKTVLISNTGNDTMNFTRVAFTSGNTADFAIDPNTTSCNFTMPLYSGHSCSVGFIFSPTAVGARSAVLSLLDDTIEGIDTIQMSGNGAAPAHGVISPTSLSFPSQSINTSSPPKTITLSNTGGSPLSITSYTFTGTNASDFSQTNNCTSTLAAAASCTINVVFKPLATGTRSAGLSIATGSGTLTASLSGAAVAVKSNVTLASRANPAAQGAAILLTSKVAAASTAMPAGMVELREGSRIIAESTLINGSATFNVTNFAPGTHVLNAVYLGDKQHQGSTSAALSQVVGPRPQSPRSGSL